MIDLDKIIKDNEGAMFSSKCIHDYERSIMKEAIKQALELACERAEAHGSDICQWVDKESIMSVWEDLQ